MGCQSRRTGMGCQSMGEIRQGKPDRTHMHTVARKDNGMLQGTTCSMRTLQPYGKFTILLMRVIVAAYVHTCIRAHYPYA